MSQPTASNSNSGTGGAVGTTSAGSSVGLSGYDVETQQLQFVAHYLRSKGFQKTELQLRAEAKLESVSNLQNMAKRVAREASLPDFVLFYNEKEASNPAAYETSYGRLRKWIDESIVKYQVELRRILWPTFVNSYLDLVSKNIPDQAKHFLELFKSDHIEEHSPEINRMSYITTPQHVAENQLAKDFRAGKYWVVMSRYSFELLLNFLMENEFMLILRIINQYVDIKVRDQDVGEKELVAGGGADDGRVEFFNKQPVMLAPLPLDPAFATEMELLLNQEGGGPGMADKSMLQKIKREPAADSPHRDNVPQPPRKLIDASRELAALQDARKRVALSASSLPSVCMYTFHNTYDSMNCVSVSADTSMICGGFAESHLRLWNLKRDESQQADQRLHSENGLRMIGHAGPVYGTSISRDNRYIVSCSEDKTVRLWSTVTNKNVVCYKGHNYPVWDVDFGPECVYFATGSHDRTARIWSCDQIYPLRILAGHSSDVDCVRFHPNGNYVATGSSDRTARLWDVQRGACVRIFAKHTAPVYAVAISPNGRMLATAGEDKKVMLWDISHGRCLKTMEGHTDVVYSLSFSEDSTIVASGGADNTVRLWDVKGSEGNKVDKQHSYSDLIKTFYTKRTPVQKVQFTQTNVLVALGAYSR
ncbi:WD40-repeat-containing domain protein [Cladochytrium replicatum]|nr:WD40-repeat-containing domain protein [Cladochytrium replicatum]